MSRDASVELEFGGATRVLRTPYHAWEKIQDRCDAGPEELLRRYVTGTWRVDDVREVWRQGLIFGGPMDVAAADKLLRTEFDDLPMLQFVPGAQAIVMAFLVGAPDDPPGPPPGEPDAGADQPSRTSPAESSGSPGSTATAP